MKYKIVIELELETLFETPDPHALIRAEFEDACKFAIDLFDLEKARHGEGL